MSILQQRAQRAGTGILYSGGRWTIDAAVQADQETASSVAKVVVPGVQQFHPSAAKAWVKFNSAGSAAASYNVSSVTDNGTGDWTVNIGTDMSSAAYAGFAFGGFVTGVAAVAYNVNAIAAGTFQILASRTDTSARVDPTSVDYISFVAYGDQ